MKTLGVLCGLILKVFFVLQCTATDTNGHKFHTLTNKRTHSILQCADSTTSFDEILPNILQVRVPDTPGHAKVKEYIVSQLNELDCSRWEITLDTFQSNTPLGEKTFTNIIATLDPQKSKRLVLAAHYDSKLSPKGFLGATDSAVPVALILDVVLTLSKKLEDRELQDYSLQIIFFDGEEALVRWTNDDSLYGSRHLAEEMSREGGLLSVDGKTGIQAMEAMILLDLIGSSDTKFLNMYKSGSKIYERLERIEKRVEGASGFTGYSSHSKLFKLSSHTYEIQDDHKPFHERGVPIVHLISVPFPTVWHKLSDNLDAINMDLVNNFKKILIIFLNEYFYLR